MRVPSTSADNYLWAARKRGSLLDLTIRVTGRAADAVDLATSLSAYIRDGGTPVTRGWRREAVERAMEMAIVFGFETVDGNSLAGEIIAAAELFDRYVSPPCETVADDGASPDKEDRLRDIRDEVLGASDA